VKTVELADGYSAGKHIGTDDHCRAYVAWAPTWLPDGGRWSPEDGAYVYGPDEDPTADRPEIRREVYRARLGEDGQPVRNAFGEEVWACG
jgi:hypothetical protein